MIVNAIVMVVRPAEVGTTVGSWLVRGCLKIGDRRLIQNVRLILQRSEIWRCLSDFA